MKEAAEEIKKRKDEEQRLKKVKDEEIRERVEKSLGFKFEDPEKDKFKQSDHSSDEDGGERVT